MQLNLYNVDLLKDCLVFTVFPIQIDLNVFISRVELRRLVTDLIWCYKIVFGHVDVDIGDVLKIRPVSRTRGHDYKLYKSHVVPFSVSVS